MPTAHIFKFLWPCCLWSASCEAVGRLALNGAGSEIMFDQGAGSQRLFTAQSLADIESALTQAETNIVQLQTDVGTKTTEIQVNSLIDAKFTSASTFDASTVYANEVYSRGALVSQGGQVQRDFATFRTTASNGNPIHIKTTIGGHSNTMFRILVEGYNYGVYEEIMSSTVGYTYSLWACSSSTGTLNARNVDHSAGGSSCLFTSF